MITAQFWGGLGNQMFQAAAAVGLAKRHSDVAAFNFGNWRRSSQGQPPETYRNGMFARLFTTDRTDWRYHQDNGVWHRPIKYRTHLELRGLFQSAKYFSDCSNLIIRMFEPPKDMADSVRATLTDMDSELVALHVRRGDYLDRANSPCEPLSLDYYQEAIAQFPAAKFFICSDNLDYCKSKFQGERFIFSSGESEEHDLWQMSLCHHQIIANSTFSWWAAWLNKNPNKRVIAPKNWSHRRNEDNDIYTDWMIKI